MNRLIHCLLCLSTLLGWSIFAHAEDDDATKLYLYTENYGAYNYSLNGRDYEHWGEDIGGTSTDFVKTLMAESGLDYRMRLRTWRVGYQRTLDRPNYGLFSTARTDQREDLFEWVGPIAQYNWIVFRYKDSGVKVNSLEDLRSLRVGGYDNSATTLYLQDQGIDVSTLPNDSLNPQRLAQGQIDVWIASDVSAYRLAEDAGFADIEPAWVLRTVDMYLAMNKETPKPVLDRLHAAYETVAQSRQ
ncbi:substrate-binding periplasmic protein [Saccharospirillum salsuginis]|uniref:Solute-binding protein family 3/N-terminal domain-containing protein n=1 Tax=Saccharospirillum salsuginis TaxID=418750 RepID=A0A918NCT0_9GAMM|nr:transporter substrate-binding domain-containing protein [Saccharospirillum salsuginis]GGX58190.1 hypothetical protein GCM10007392_27430 [Saccharospirillum salsuginis]